jgi:hypothetical protein
MVVYIKSFQGAYHLYDLVTHRKHHEAIFHEPIPHALQDFFHHLFSVMIPLMIISIVEPGMDRGNK